MLERLFANSLHQLEGLKVFDSQAFFKHLDSLKEGTFQSKAAQDFIEIASGFNKLFNQDAKLAKALKSTTGEQVTSSIATSVSGAAQYQITKALFSIVVRTMPHIPFFKGLNSKVSAAALRHHLKAALNKSASVQDFKIQLNHLVQRQDFDNATKALIREIEGGLPPDDGGGGGALPSDGGGGRKPPSSDDLLDPSKPLRKARPEEITQELLDRVKETNAKIWVGDLTNPQILEHLGLEPNKVLKFIAEGDVLKHVESRHGKDSIHAKRGQPAIETADIANYPNMVNGADIIQIKKHNNIRTLVSGKQINGYFIVVETVDAKNGQLILKTMYKEGGKLENSPVFKGGENIRLSQDSGESIVATDASLPLDAISRHQANPTTPTLKNQANMLYTTAKEQEGGFKQLLESLTQPSSTLEAGNILKSQQSIISKLERKQGRAESLNDLLRGAIIAKDREVIDDQLAQIAIKLRDAQIPHTIEYKENRGSGYEGIHIHFKHNDVSAEIQVHTPKNWAVKKKQDESYHVTRDNEITKKLSETQVKELLQKSRALGQESDLDISLLTSFEVISTEFSGSAMSVNLKNAATDSNLTHTLRLKSYSKEPPPSNDASAYKRPDSELNQNDNLFSGSGNIQTPLKQDSTTPQTSPLSIHQQALQARQAREQAKLEAKVLEEQKQAQAGGKQNDKNLEIGESIPMQKLEGYSSSVSLDDARIYPLDFVIVKSSDIKPNLAAGVGTQTRTQTNPQRIEEIAKDFKPTMLFNRGGFDDLPIILSDGQVIAGNHRAKGMQSFSPKSREAYERAVLEHYNIKLQSDELLLRTPREGLDKQEIINLAAASNEKRIDSIGDMLVSALGKYDAYITPKNLDSILGIEHTSAADLTNRLAKTLDKNSASPSVEEPSLALLANAARNTPRLNLAEALNHAQKILEPAEFKNLKEMFSHNAPSFYLLMRDSRFPSLNLAPLSNPRFASHSYSPQSR
ncbi:hypothetical protein [Helicobacter bizzozeronii]|uniref:PBECR3 domain-containing polyvalent protein n=1 Tax=Helicobacter bizzozeronii TaxID=56877 RepID=UPI002553AF09|nr:hypothetical protein [Helicobacter bizzozeronii]